MSYRIPAAIILILLFFGASAAEESLPFTGIVKEDGINIRSDSTVSSAIVGSAKKGQEVTVIRQAYEWYKICFPLELPCEEPARNFAWIHKKFIEKKAQVVQAAAAQIRETQKKQPVSFADEITITGTLKPYGKVLGRRATHKLITEDKQVFLLKGDKKELNALNSRRVKVRGIKEPDAPKKAKYPLIEVKTIEEIN
ncbi:MAG: SH3 domain-containing protein [Candidatus Omnitrophota bacterium]